MPEGFLTALSAVMNVLFLVGGIYIYLSLVRQVAARTSTGIDEPEATLGWPDVFLAVLLAALFAFSVAAGSASGEKLTMGTRELVANGLISAAIFVFVAAFLKIRGLNLSALAGFNRFGFWRTLVTGVVLLFAAYPLIFLADLLSQRVLGGTTSKQGIVELFNDSQTIQQRVLIIVLAVVIAPMVEEFVFRFYLYGVMRKYVGRFAGLVANALLFAAVHGHVPSAAPLFVLGACFTLAYEWSGSILVAMTMHALFNSLTLTRSRFRKRSGNEPARAGRRPAVAARSARPASEPRGRCRSRG
jgi:membrane protease YdiL (CAAX protease family)